MSFSVWPYMKDQGTWTIPYGVMFGVWDKMVELNRVKPTWYDGSVKTGIEFIGFMRDPKIFPALVVDPDVIGFKLLAWLSDFNDGVAKGHFCFLDKYDPEIGKTMIDFWRKIETVRVIFGITPESYKTAMKIIQRLGFQIVGTIPDICNMVYLDRREGGMISYYLTKEGEENGRQKHGRTLGRDGQDGRLATNATIRGIIQGNGTG